ncbi:recombinase family protein [Candidatus Woesearchaeota archaeon]|nr:recombinase family protein [Candidatus Woesearchaeota archaeon]
MTLSTQTNPIGKPTAAIYVRVSTEDQVRHGYSIIAQEEALRNYCTALGYEVFKVYKDEGKSAKDMKNRPAMQSLLKDAEAKKFAAIFIYKLDRFSRSIMDLILTIDQIKSWGIDFISLQDRIETVSATGKLMFHIVSAFAEFESNVISERTKFTMGSKASKGSFMSKAPLGYNFVDKQLVVDEAGAKKLLAIFKEFIGTSSSLNQLAKKHNLSTRGLIKLLSNKTYLGIVKFDKEYPGNHQPILDKKIFDSAQKKLEKNQKDGPNNL